MKTVHSLFFLFFILTLLSTGVAEADGVVSSKELLENPDQYNGQEVRFEGEVIGDIMVRGRFAWINVRDEQGALGVFCPLNLIETIEHQGSYKFRGDVVSVYGKFYRACTEHGGDTDIHAEKISIVQKGGVTSHPLDPQKTTASIILPAVVLVLAIVHLIARKFR